MTTTLDDRDVKRVVKLLPKELREGLACLRGMELVDDEKPLIFASRDLF